MQYVTNQATRIIVKAAGDLAPEAVASVFSLDAVFEEEDVYTTEEAKESIPSAVEEVAVDIESYTPNIRADRTWSVSDLDLSTSNCLVHHCTCLTTMFCRVDRRWVRDSGHRWRRNNVPAVPYGPSAAP